MLKIHQPYKYKSKYILALGSTGVFLLGSLWFCGRLWELSSSFRQLSSANRAVAAGDSRTIHDISDMQEMTQQICSNTDEGDTGTLSDSCDANSYVVVKLKDGNCWMQENLRLGGSSVMTLTSTDSDLASGTSSWELPASASNARWGGSGSWGTSDTATQMRVGEPDMPVSPADSGDGNGWQPGYGNYYSWYTATAGAGSSSVSSGDVSTSICPKGWKLPAYDGTGSFYNIISGTNGYKSSWTTVNGKNGYKFGHSSNDAFWPAAGNVGSGSLHAGSNGLYWSRRASAASRAYNLTFYSSDVYPQGTSDRFLGFSVRCVTPGGLDKIEKPLFTDEKDGNITVTMPSVISIDAASGMSKTANATEIAEGTVTATISSNTEHAVTLHSAQPSLKDPTATTAEISPVSTTNPVQPGNNSWGFWDSTGDSNHKSYTLPITTAPQNLYNSKETVTNTEGNPATKHTYYVGISISPSLPSGTYATDVIITASAK